MKSSHTKKDEKSEIQRQIERSTGIDHAKSAADEKEQNNSISHETMVKLVFFCSLFASLFAFLKIFDYYLWTFLAFIVSMLAASIAAGLAAIIFSAYKNKITVFCIIIAICMGYWGADSYIDAIKAGKMEKSRIANLENIEIKKRFDAAPFRCNEEQRTAAQNHRELLISNKIATRELESGSWVTYYWHRNWWFMSEQEQNAAISKVADIEACFSKEGFSLPTVTIVYLENNVARADSSNGPRVLKRKP